MARLTKRSVDGLKAGEREYFVWDEDMPGFGIRVMPTGHKGYLVQYRDTNGRTRRQSLGRHGTVTADEARTEARELLSAAARGHNPVEENKRRRAAPTMAELCDRFLSEYVPTHCKASTAKEYRRCVDLFIKPALGPMKAEEITRTQIAELHHKYRGIPYQANRILGVLSVLFNQAEIWGLRTDGSNPCRHVKKYAEEKRERYLMPEELARLGEALDAMEASREESVPAINAIRLLILTGCRLGEIQTLKWEYIQGNSAWLPESKTGAKRVYLGAAALDVLARIDRVPGNPYVITGKLPGSHLTDMQKPWRRIRARAGLEDVRIHDLRHSFASNAVGLGESLPMIGKLLGHSNVQTTARYAHLADDPMKLAADRVSNDLARLLGSKAAAA